MKTTKKSNRVVKRNLAERIIAIVEDARKKVVATANKVLARKPQSLFWIFQIRFTHSV